MEKKHWYDLPSSDRQNGRTFSIFFCFHKRYTFFFLSEMIWYFIFLFLVSSRISLLSLFILKNVTCIKHLCIETHLTLDVHKNTDIRIGMVKSSRNEIFPQLWSDKQIWELFEPLLIHAKYFTVLPRGNISDDLISYAFHWVRQKRTNFEAFFLFNSSCVLTYFSLWRLEKWRNCPYWLFSKSSPLIL